VPATSVGTVASRTLSMSRDQQMRTFLINALGVALVSGAVYAVLDGHELAAVAFAIPAIVVAACIEFLGRAA
jgi:hypothetical protein